MSFRAQRFRSYISFGGEGEMMPLRRFPWAAIGVAMSLQCLLLVLTLTANQACIAQSTAGVSQPLDIKTGMWEITTHTSLDLDLSLSADDIASLKKLPPDQYAKQLAAAKAGREQIRANAAKGSTQTNMGCITPASLRQGSIFVPISCLKGITSSSRGLNVEMNCNDGNTVEVVYERIDPEHIHATAKITTIGPPPGVVHKTYTAHWISDVCGSRGDLLRPRGLAAGANPAVLDFLPYNLPGDEGHIGRIFVYYWYNGPTAAIPQIGYIDGIPGERASNITSTLFHGTDGHYLYVTLVDHGSPCASASKSYQIDKAGKAALIPEIPRGLKGGEDQLHGGPPCAVQKTR